MRGRRRKERRVKLRKEDREVRLRMGEGLRWRWPAPARSGVTWRLVAARFAPRSACVVRWCGGRPLVQWPQRVGDDTCSWCTMATGCSSCAPQHFPSTHSRSGSKDAEAVVQLPERVGR